MDHLKMGHVIFQKHFRKLSRGRVPKQTCSQSVVRGVSTHDMKKKAFSEQPRRVREKKSIKRLWISYPALDGLKERKACDRIPRLLCFFSIGE